MRVCKGTTVPAIDGILMTCLHGGDANNDNVCHVCAAKPRSVNTVKVGEMESMPKDSFRFPYVYPCRFRARFRLQLRFRCHWSCRCRCLCRCLSHRPPSSPLCTGDGFVFHGSLGVVVVRLEPDHEPAQDGFHGTTLQHRPTRRHGNTWARFNQCLGRADYCT